MLSSNLFNLEPLESRQLLAGVTLLIHGHQGSIDGWVRSAADAIAERVGTLQLSQYVLKVAENAAGTLTVTSFSLQHGPQLNTSTSGEAVVKVDWTSVDDGSYSTEDVGRVVADYLLSAHGKMRALAELPIHLIGHSRGASLAVGITQRLGRAGVWVDQETFLDPRPVEKIFGIGYGDIAMRVHSNVIFADNYWRSDGNLFNIDPDGMHVNGAHEGNLNDIVQDHFVVSAHMAVTAYYHGTIDLDAVANRDHPVFGSWYGSTPDRPARDKTGYVFSRLGNGTRPADGLIAAFGGTASRTSIAQTGAQWSNGGRIGLVGGATFTVGDKVTLKFIRQDRDSPTNVTIVLDRDNNPYNNNLVRVMRRATLEASPNMTLTSLSAFTGGVDPGRYFVYAAFTDAQGHVRFAYSRRITLNAAASAQSFVADARPPKTTPFSTSATPISQQIL